MYHASYAEVLLDDPRDARRNERRAFSRAIELLGEGSHAGPGTVAASTALVFVQELWSILISDLASPGNDLPDTLRAELMSIGLWVLNEIRKIRFGESRDLVAIRDICQIICNGLK